MKDDNFLSKNALPIFGQLLDNLGYFFNPTSGHTECELFSFQECNIGYEDVAKTELIHVCSEKAERDCNEKGEDVCSTVYVTSKYLYTPLKGTICPRYLILRNSVQMNGIE